MDEWLSEYGNAKTRSTYRYAMNTVMAGLDATRLADLTAGALGRWLDTLQVANNTARVRVNAVRLFLTWAEEVGHLHQHRDKPYKRLLESFPQTYGKVQGRRPPVRLTKVELDRLLAACQDGTEAGLRDELTIRLAVAGGMRSEELLTLTVADTLRTPGRLDWIGKRNKARTANLGDKACAALATYLRAYVGATPDAPLLCGQPHYARTGLLRWGQRFTRSSLATMLERRCAAAGLPPMAPHDLKRTTARILHDSRSADGGHLFDLVDIADVLDHTNSEVTKRCYIGPLDNANKERAAGVLD